MMRWIRYMSTKKLYLNGLLNALHNLFSNMTLHSVAKSCERSLAVTVRPG